MAENRDMNRFDSMAAPNKFVSKLLSPLTIGVLGCLICAFYSVTAGESINWDLQNYHYYTGFALYKGVEMQHIIPAQQQTFINPTISLPSYLLIAHLPPMFVGFIFGVLQGLNFLLIYLFSREIISNIYSASIKPTMRALIALSIAVIGITAPMFVSEIGTTIGDNVTSIFVLAALLIVFKKPPNRTWLYPIIGGLLIGAATALKLTNAVFVVALIGCGWWYKNASLKRSVTTLVVFAVGILFGFLLFQGYWSWHLLKEYQNPLFPYFNALFKSPYYDPINIADTRFIPHSIPDALSYPFQWAIGLHPSSELPFRDLRFAVLSVLILVAVPIAIARIVRRQTDPVYGVKFNVMFFFLISYFIWIFISGIQRYIIVLELLSGLVIFLLIMTVIRTLRHSVFVFALVAVVLVASSSPPDWGRTCWSPTWYDIKTPVELTASDEMFVMLGNDPLSYVIPFFPSDARFVRIQGNFRPSQQTKLGELIYQTIRNHTGAIYSFSTEELSDNQIQLLAKYGLAVAAEPYIEFSSKAHSKLLVCPLCRISTGNG